MIAEMRPFTRRAVTVLVCHRHNHAEHIGGRDLAYPLATDSGEYLPLQRRAKPFADVEPPPVSPNRLGQPDHPLGGLLESQDPRRSRRYLPSSTAHSTNGLRTPHPPVWISPRSVDRGMRSRATADVRVGAGNHRNLGVTITIRLVTRRPSPIRSSLAARLRPRHGHRWRQECTDPPGPLLAIRLPIRRFLSPRVGHGTTRVTIPRS